MPEELPNVRAFGWLVPTLLAGGALVALAGPAGAATDVPPECITVDTTWTLAGSPHIIEGNNGPAVCGDGTHFGPKLTIEPGVVVEFGPVTGLNFRDGAQLRAVGTEAQPILFTSHAAEKRPGDWIGIGGTDTGGEKHLENVTIEYAGSPVTGTGALSHHGHGPGRDLVVKNCVLRHNAADAAAGARAALHANTESGAVSIIEGCDVHDTTVDGRFGRGANAGTGIFLRGDYRVVGNRVHDNAGYGIFDFLGGHQRRTLVADNVLARNDIPLHIPADADIRDNIFDGNARNEIEVVPCGSAGFLCIATAHWQRNLDQATGALIVYHFPRIVYHQEGGGGFDVRPGGQLTIDPGNVLSFARDGGASVAGSLVPCHG